MTMHVVHLTAAPFLGGPERQMLGLARQLRGSHRTTFLAFTEGGRSQPFLQAARADGHGVVELVHNAPCYRAAVGEIAAALRELQADILVCHGYKPDVLGYWGARRAGVPVVAVSRGWTWATWKVRLNEAIDRLHLRWMDRVVCVSGSQAERVRRAGVDSARIQVIHNAIDVRRFQRVNPAQAVRLNEFFPVPVQYVIGLVGRLSPEKGFDVAVAAAAQVLAKIPEAGFVLFGEGPERSRLENQVRALGLTERFRFAGFRSDVDQFLPHLDLLLLSSHTEGLPNVVLEAFAASVPVVATAVGGVPEVVTDGEHGYLVPPRRPELLAERIAHLLRDGERRRAFGRAARLHVERTFTFAAQARGYASVFDQLLVRRARSRGRHVGQEASDGSALADVHPAMAQATDEA